MSTKTCSTLAYHVLCLAFGLLLCVSSHSKAEQIVFEDHFDSAPYQDNATPNFSKTDRGDLPGHWEAQQKGPASIQTVTDPFLSKGRSLQLHVPSPEAHIQLTAHFEESTPIERIIRFAFRGLPKVQLDVADTDGNKSANILLGAHPSAQDVQGNTSIPLTDATSHAPVTLAENTWYIVEISLPFIYVEVKEGEKLPEYEVRIFKEDGKTLLAKATPPFAGYANNYDRLTFQIDPTEDTNAPAFYLDDILVDVQP